MKNSILIISIFVFIFCSVSNINAQITNDNSKGIGFELKLDKPSFSINFPFKYKLEESSEENGFKTELFKALSGNDAYMLKYKQHENPAVSADNEVYMNASLESFVNGIKGSLIKKDNFKHKKNNGTEAFITLDNKNMNVFYRVLIIDKIQYQLIVITNAEEKTSLINNFFNSFVCPSK